MATEAELDVKRDQLERQRRWSEEHWNFWPLRYEGAPYKKPMLGVDMGLTENGGAIICMHPLDYIWALYGDDPLRAHELSRARQAYDLERLVQIALARLERPTPGEIREQMPAMQDLFPDVRIVSDAEQYKQQLEWVQSVLRGVHKDPRFGVHKGG